MTLAEALELVRQFHQHIGAPVADQPCLLPCTADEVNRFATNLLEQSLLASQQGAATGDQVLLRLGMMLEEISEFLLAHSKRDLVAAADAWADGLYVWLGNAVVMGLPGESLMTEVHASNMTKSAGETNWPGKGVRGEAFRRPDIKGVLLARRLQP